VKFSIITPNLDQGAYLPECLESVKNQIGQSEGAKVERFYVEHIVMDGGSSDASRDILNTWMENIQRISLPGYSFRFVSEKDSGQTDAINKGFRQASGDLLAYLCADDFYESGALARVARFFSERPEAEFVYGGYNFVEGSSGWKRAKRPGFFDGKRLLKNNFLGQPAVFWSQKVYQDWGEFDPDLRFSMDYDYWLRALNANWIYAGDPPLASMRLHFDGKTGKYISEMWHETGQVLHRHGAGSFGIWHAKWMELMGGRLYLLRRILYAIVGNFLRRRNR